MKITHIDVLVNVPSVDFLFIHTDLPPTLDGEDHLILKVEVGKNKGAEYAIKHFPDVPKNQISGPTGMIPLTALKI
jgi:hypothetical protein